MGEEAGSNELTTREGNEVARYVMDLEVVPEGEGEGLTQGLTRIPFAELVSLGAGLGSLPESARTITKTVTSGGGETLYRCVFPEGVSGTLAQAKDGKGYLGTILDHGIKGQARWIPVEPGTTTVSTVVPFDPTTLAVAVALSSINIRLDKIQETQQQILDFLKTDKESKQLGDLNALIDILGHYKLNWDNDTFVTSNLTTVQQVHVRAQQNIEFFRKEARKAAKPKVPVQNSLTVGQVRNGVIYQLRQYQAAAYLFAFSAMLDALLLKNFDAAYLAKVEQDIDRESLRYRRLYTEVYDKVAKLQRESVGAVLVSGFSDAVRGLGKAIEQTPVLGDGPVDELLIGMGDGAGELGVKMQGDAMRDLVSVQAAQVQPFVATIESVDAFCNRPSEVLVDQDGLYLRLGEEARRQPTLNRARQNRHRALA